MNELWMIGLTGAAVGGALGWPLVRGPLVTNAGTARSMRQLGVLLLMGGATVGLIAMRHSTLLPSAIATAAEHVVYAGNLTFWGALAIWVRSAMGRSTHPYVSAAMLGAPLVAYVGAALQMQSAPRFIWLLPAGTVATTYMCALWWRNRERHADGVRRALLARMVALAVALNTAQAIRTFFPDVEVLREIVPITMTAAFLSLAALAVRHMLSSDAHVTVETPRPYAKSALDFEMADRLLAALDDGMSDAHWYRDATLSLNDLASRLDSRPHLVSQALNQVKGITLHEYLATWRVADARRLLADPASDRFTIDALAESAGFASRSAFYKAFKASEGVTPTEFRARVRSDSARGPGAGM
jgi:AraC-like DNA-binding protein